MAQNSAAPTAKTINGKIDGPVRHESVRETFSWATELVWSVSVARTKKSKASRKLDGRGECLIAGAGGAKHQTRDAAQASLTTYQGVIVADNYNTLKSKERGPSLLKDLAFGEKINHFDDEGVIE